MEKRIYKSERNRVLTGTCGGIGEYLNIDPTIVRLIFVGITFFSGIGIFAYIVAALLIPNSPIDNFENMNNYEYTYEISTTINNISNTYKISGTYYNNSNSDLSART